MGATAAGEEALIANAMKSVRQHMQQKTADELVRVEPHDFALPVAAVIFEGEGDFILIDRDEP